MELNLPAMRRHVEFLLASGIRNGTGIRLAGGAAGDFSTLTLAERIHVAVTVASLIPAGTPRPSDVTS